jgi:hypothetical protein
MGGQALSWKDDAVRMRMDENRPWREIAETLRPNFPDKDLYQAIGKVRVAVKESKRWQEEKAKKAAPNPEAENTEQTEQANYKSTNGWKNGVFESDDLIRMCQEDGKSPRRMLELHNLDPDEWEVVSYRNNLWHGQTHHNFRAAEGPRTLLYQSKLTAKPIGDKLTLKDIAKWFDTHDFDTAKPPVIPMWYDPDGETLEICVPDLHSGLYAWAAETGANYDVNIARDLFFQAMRDIISRINGRKFKKIILALLGDLLHTDNDAQTTTKGTFQQVDGRIPRVATKTLDMLVEVIDWLGAIALVDVVYTRGNHDMTTGWMLIKAVEQAYRKDPNVFIDVSPDPQKDRLIGNTLVGFVHGDMPPKNLAGWLQVRARKMAVPIRWMEVHSGDKHVERVRERLQTDDAEGVIVRTMPTICNSSTWEHHEGYTSNRAMMCFVWGDSAGLRETWYSNM